MRKPLRIHKTWLVALAITIIALGTLISVLVFATGDSRLTATAYSDVIRFQAEGVATLQVRIFDLSGKEVWNSGIVSGWTVDWDRRNDTGERLAYGAYIYSAQGWNAQGDLNFQKNGKLALMPGDKVQLQAAPVVSSPPTRQETPPLWDASLTFQPKAVNVDHSTESWAFGQVGIGTTNPAFHVDINGGLRVQGNDNPSSGTGMELHYQGGEAYFTTMDRGTSPVTYKPFNLEGSLIKFKISASEKVRIDSDGHVGIGTTNPSATLEVHGSATNLLALYDPVAPTNPKFRVTKTGEVRADGAYYGASYNTGSADVAERINVSESVKAGCVVEIDPEHPGFFRKSTSPYSTKVAGIISISPGVILGNSFDETTDDWEDNRPLLAIAGRVPLKVTTENGSIEIGDLLVSASTPGYAMRCSNRATCVGTTIGKALEPLEEGTGEIMIQVMLR
jgi:hypothetical protein